MFNSAAAYAVKHTVVPLSQNWTIAQVNAATIQMINGTNIFLKGNPDTRSQERAVLQSHVSSSPEVQWGDASYPW